jgi:ubiquinone biosynthesis protein
MITDFKPDTCRNTQLASPKQTTISNPAILPSKVYDKIRISKPYRLLLFGREILTMTVIPDNRSNGFIVPAKKTNHHLRRYRQIALVMAKYRLHDIIRTLGLEKFLPFHRIPPGNPFQKQVYTKPVRTRMALEELGTTFVKLGQILSTRNDLLPLEYIRELSKLQNSLQPIHYEIIESLIKNELGRPPKEIFSSIDPSPAGVASIGQVHAATLLDGTEVVIKVRKPGVKEQVEEDVEILRQLAVSTSQHWSDGEPYDLPGVVEEVAETLLSEMDYMREGRNAGYFAQFFQSDTSVHIPRIFLEYTTPRMLIMERIRGIGILDIQSLDKAGFDRRDLARRSVDLWLKMVFDGEMFHADPHPGNLFVEKDGRLGLIDFGMVGMVDDEVRESLSGTIAAILSRDVDKLIDSLVDLGAVRQRDSRENLRLGLKHVMGHYPTFSLEEVHDNSSLSELLAVVRRNHVTLPSNTFLLLKTMVMAQSLGKSLDSGFDILKLVEPSVKRILEEKHSSSAVIQQLPSTAIEFAGLSIGLPQRLNRIMKSVERGEFQFRTDVSGLELHLEHLEKIVNRLILGLLISAIVIGLAIFFLGYQLAH